MTTLRKLLERKSYIRVPIQQLTTGHYQFEAIINKKSGLFILDTGASSSCICLDFATYFHLTPEETEIKAAGAGATEMETKVARRNEIQLGSITIRQFDFVLFNMIHVNNALAQAGEKRVHGILGADILKKLHAVIDYGRNCVYFKK